MRTAAIVFSAALALSCSRGATESETFELPAHDPGASAPSRACSDDVAMFLGRMYFVVNPMHEQKQPRAIERFIEENASQLSADSPAVRCAAAAAQHSMSHALGTFDRAGADRAYERAVGFGATGEQAESVRSSFNEGSVQVYTIAQELAWIASVVPSAAAGDYGPFTTTATDARRMFRQAWPMYQQVLALDPSNTAIVEAAIHQAQPWLEYQIAYLVSLTPA
jgi:hypothetical protein